jgi:hypothetical protein
VKKSELSSDEEMRRLMSWRGELRNQIHVHHIGNFLQISLQYFCFLFRMNKESHVEEFVVDHITIFHHEDHQSFSQVNKSKKGRDSDDDDASDGKSEK